VTKKSKNPSDPILEVLDKLFGQVEDMSQDELSSSIADAGIDLTAARRKLYERVSAMRSKLWERNENESADMKSLLAQLRPHDLPTADPKVAQKAAGNWLRDLVDRRPTGGRLEFAAAARNLDGPLSDRDRDVMRELEEELRSEHDDKGSE
jgi:hypothetical protein